MRAIPVDLRADGVLWAINKAVFHPRGFALAIETETGALTLLGDGSEPWTYAGDEDATFAAFAALLARAGSDAAGCPPSCEATTPGLDVDGDLNDVTVSRRIAADFQSFESHEMPLWHYERDVELIRWVLRILANPLNGWAADVLAAIQAARTDAS